MIRGVIFDIHGTLINPSNHKPFKNAEKLLKRLAGTYKLAYATSWGPDRVEAILGDFDLLKYFDAQCYDREAKKGKPSADVYKLAAKRLELEPHECLVVEDSERCLASASKAQFTTIAHETVHNSASDFSDARYIVDDLLEIDNILEGHLSKLNNPYRGYGRIFAIFLLEFVLVMPFLTPLWTNIQHLAALALVLINCYLLTKISIRIIKRHLKRLGLFWTIIFSIAPALMAAAIIYVMFVLALLAPGQGIFGPNLVDEQHFENGVSLYIFDGGFLEHGFSEVFLNKKFSPFLDKATSFDLPHHELEYQGFDDRIEITVPNGNTYNIFLN